MSARMAFMESSLIFSGCSCNSIHWSTPMASTRCRSAGLGPKVRRSSACRARSCCVRGGCWDAFCADFGTALSLGSARAGPAARTTVSVILAKSRIVLNRLRMSVRHPSSLLTNLSQERKLRIQARIPSRWWPVRAACRRPDRGPGRGPPQENHIWEGFRPSPSESR